MRVKHYGVWYFSMLSGIFPASSMSHPHDRSSRFTLFLNEPPSCILIAPLDPSLVVIGTYLYDPEKNTKAGSVQLFRKPRDNSSLYVLIPYPNQGASAAFHDERKLKVSHYSHNGIESSLVVIILMQSLTSNFLYMTRTISHPLKLWAVSKPSF